MRNYAVLKHVTLIRLYLYPNKKSHWKQSKKKVEKVEFAKKGGCFGVCITFTKIDHSDSTHLVRQIFSNETTNPHVYVTVWTYTLWLFNIAMGNDPFSLPITNGGSFHGYVSHNQMVVNVNMFGLFIPWELILVNIFWRNKKTLIFDYQDFCW
jgi:hypothetical protein